MTRKKYTNQPKGESNLNLELMRLIDEHYLEHSYKGATKMYIWLTMDMGCKVSRNRIEQLNQALNL